MDYINRFKLYDLIIDLRNTRASSFPDQSSLTEIQWIENEEQKIFNKEKLKIASQEFIGKYFKDDFEISDITEHTIITLVPYKHTTIALHFEYENSIRSKLMTFNKGDILVKLEGKIKSISSAVVFLELTSIKKSVCLVATACYGDYNAPQVLVLRQFRDEKLLRTFLGDMLVNFYYSVSPTLATAISKSNTLKKIVRYFFLDPVVRKLKRQQLRN